MNKPEDSCPLADAVRDAFISPNVVDGNLEPANVVDVLHSLAWAVGDLAIAVRENTRARKETTDAIR